MNEYIIELPNGQRVDISTIEAALQTTNTPYSVNEMRTTKKKTSIAYRFSKGVICITYGPHKIRATASLEIKDQGLVKKIKRESNLIFKDVI